MSYYKRAADTAISVTWNGNVYLYGTNVNIRYHITFNGNECADPGPIELPVYRSSAYSQHRHNMGKGSLLIFFVCLKVISMIVFFKPLLCFIIITNKT